jgi:hypothetical protein
MFLCRRQLQKVDNVPTARVSFLERNHIDGAKFLSRRLNGRRGSGSNEFCLVGARGFEPPTPASRTQCATGLRYAPT